MRAYAIVVVGLFLFTGVFGWVISHDMSAGKRRALLSFEIRRLETAVRAYEDHLAAYRDAIVELRDRETGMGDAAATPTIREFRSRIDKLEAVRASVSRRLETAVQERRSHPGLVFEFD